MQLGSMAFFDEEGNFSVDFGRVSHEDVDWGSVTMSFFIAMAQDITMRALDRATAVNEGNQGRETGDNDTTLVQTGARTVIPNDDFDLAEKEYELIRADTGDVDKIAENTGIKPENIQKVKNHIFYEEHLLDRYRDYGVEPEWSRFNADPEIANAWNRLSSGDYTPADIQILKHETAEAWYMRHNGPSYLEAHDAASRSFPAFKEGLK